mmetsp:Transcript_19713/g.49424  ORF Transcript_19713/g.49424 Transcript_19713/m.49424 type:complete len:298 (+) Transcript_19713:1-894(+)
MTLFRRHGVITVRDPTLYIGRMVMFLNACIFFAIIYVKCRDRVQDQVLARVWLCLWHLGVPTNLAVVAVYAYNEEYFAIRREVKNGMLSPVAYMVANFGIQVPLMIIMSVFALSVSAYGIIDYNVDNYFSVLMVYAINLWVYERIAQLLSVSFNNPLMGMLMFLNTWFASFLMNGILVAESDVIWPFRAMFWMLPMKWCLRSFLYLEFSDSIFKGATLDSSAKGFTCGADRKLQCYGVTGTQVLDSIGDNYKSIESKDNVSMDCMIMLIIGGVFMIAYFVVLQIKTTKAKAVKLPTK